MHEVKKDAFRAACVGGYAEVVAWYASIFKLADGPRRSAMGMAALHVACENGHIAIAKLAASLFTLSDADVAADKRKAFQAACDNGNFDIAQWMFTRFSSALGGHAKATDTRKRLTAGIPASAQNCVDHWAKGAICTG